MSFCPCLENGILCLPWARSLALSGTKGCEGWHSSRGKSRLVTGRGPVGTARHMVREVSVARPLLLTSNIRMMVFVLATSGASEAQRASWEGKL